MSQQGEEMDRALAAFASPVATIQLEARERWTDVIAQQLQATLGARVAGFYNYREVGGVVVGPGFASFTCMSPKVASAHIEEMLRERSLTYDPCRVETHARNRVATLDDLVNGGRVPASIRDTVRALSRRRYGHTLSNQIRVLITEGPSLLAWIGALSDDPEAFGPREKAILRRLVPMLRRRLEVEARLDVAPLQTAALDVALESLVEPAYLVDGRGHPVLMNVGARELWSTSRDTTRIQITNALLGDRAHFRVNPVSGRGFPAYWLLVGRSEESEAKGRAAWAQKAWSLTPRESEVLVLVARGLTNAAIGRELACAPRTVELHVTHLMFKARVSNRASLVARFWTAR